MFISNVHGISLIFFIFSLLKQQILFHLSQITPRRHTIRLKDSKSSKKTKSAPAQNEYDRLCQNSLNETLRNFQQSTNLDILELPLASINKQNWRTHPRMTQTNIVEKRLNRLHDAIKTTYVSKSSFRENKSESMSDSTQIVDISITHPNKFLFISNTINQLNQFMLRNSVQIRGFRTQRNIESQLKRNPPFLARFQQAFGECDHFDSNNKLFFSHFRSSVTLFLLFQFHYQKPMQLQLLPNNVMRL